MCTCKGHDTYTNSTIDLGLGCICVMPHDWIVGPYRDWSLIMGRGTWSFTPTKGGGGAEKVLTMLMGGGGVGAQNVLGSFYVVAWSFSHSEGGFAKSFHSLKGGGGGRLGINHACMWSKSEGYGSRNLVFQSIWVGFSRYIVWNRRPKGYDWTTNNVTPDQIDVS